MDHDLVVFALGHLLINDVTPRYIFSFFLLTIRLFAGKQKKPEKKMEIDDVFTSIGDYGRGQVLIFVLICSLGQLPASWHIFAIVFLGATPEHYCKDYGESDAGEKELATGKNISSEERSSCENSYGNSTVTCETGWVYTTDVYGSTIVSEVGRLITVSLHLQHH